MKKNPIGALPTPELSALARVVGKLSHMFSAIKKQILSLAYACDIMPEIRTKSDRYYALSVAFMVFTLFIPIVVFISAFYLYKAKKAEKLEEKEKSE